MELPDYRGCAARIEFDEAEGLFVGRIADISDVVGFHARTRGALEIAFRSAVDDYLRAIGG